MIAFLNDSFFKLIRSELERGVAQNDKFPVHLYVQKKTHSCHCVCMRRKSQTCLSLYLRM